MLREYVDVVKSLLSTNEEICFNLFSLIFEDKNAFIRTDMSSYIIAQTNVKTTIWMWISPMLKEKDTIVSVLTDRLLLNSKVHINTTPEYGERILRLGAEQIGMRNIIHLPMNVYVCYKIKYIPCRGRMIKTNKEHQKLLVYMMQQLVDAMGVDNRERLDDKVVMDMICSGKMFLWENEHGQIVSMASIDHEAEYGRISKVVTDLKYRGKGYAGMLVSEMCKELLARDVVPMLYADSRNSLSNRIYKKIGFELVGNITEYGVTNKL